MIEENDAPEHTDHIVPQPDCPRCAEVTPATVKRWILERAAAAGANVTEVDDRSRVSINPDDPSVIDITIAPQPMATYSTVVLREKHSPDDAWHADRRRAGGETPGTVEMAPLGNTADDHDA